MFEKAPPARSLKLAMIFIAVARPLARNSHVRGPLWYVVGLFLLLGVTTIFYLAVASFIPGQRWRKASRKRIALLGEITATHRQIADHFRLGKARSAKLAEIEQEVTPLREKIALLQVQADEMAQHEATLADLANIKLSRRKTPAEAEAGLGNQGK